MELQSWISKQYLAPTRIQQLRREYLRAQPTRHHALQQFFVPAKFRKLTAALKKQKFMRKEADLFSFAQTDNLFACRDPIIKEFLAFWNSKEFARYLQAITDVKTTSGKIDAAGFIYSPADHLLCHDDGFASRRIAYVVNFTTLQSKDGGALCFFGADKKGAPTVIRKRIVPKTNSLSLFSVTRTSHHMVEEVLKGTRMSIAGWFHA
jgi:Rps23 Pro-64 3,4-dihydroxylase Tpa1-like proline 4-hydroxylase